MTDLSSQTITDYPRYTFWTWLLAILLIIVLLLMWWFGRGPGTGAACCAAPVSAPVAAIPEPPPPPPEPAPLAEPVTVSNQFAAMLSAGKITLTGQVPDDATKAAYVAAAANVYGADNVIDQLEVIAGTPTRDWADALGDLFGWQQVVPDAGVAFDNGTVILTGTVTSEEEKTARGNRAQEFFGATVTIDNQIQVIAIAGTGDQVQCGDRMAVAIRFATGSSVLNDEARALLDQVLECLKEGEFEISGHTDDRGSDQSNQKLSSARAQSTLAYLVEKGADGQRLSATGYGENQPIASNDSDEGRAQNRRIEFMRR